MTHFFISILLLFASLSANAATATLIADSSLHQNPSLQSSILATLQTGTKVETIKRSGGWKLIKTKTQLPKFGWVRSYKVRLGNITIVKHEKSSGGFFSGLASLSRKASGLFSSKKKDYSFQTTATIGVRGLSEEEIKNAKPNLKQLSMLESFKTSKKIALSFSHKGYLKAVSFAHLPKSRAEK